jgi:hypothetical protein
MVSRILRAVAMPIGLLGGVVASQGPEFSQQYRQRVGGAIDELRQVVERFDADAQAHGESRDTAIARLRSNPDALASQQGAAMEANLARLTNLQQHRQAMIDAGPVARIAMMVGQADADVMRATYRDYEPAVPVTQEGLLAAGAGFVAAWGAVLLIGSLLRGLFRRRPRAADA